MAWSVPLTAVANTVLTAGEWNASIRYNLNETTPAKATSGTFLRSRYFVTDGTNLIVERQFEDSLVEAGQSTTSTSYTDLNTVGPTVTATTSNKALVWLNGQLSNSSTNTSVMAYAVTGETTVAGNDDVSLICDGGAGTLNRASIASLHSSLNDGSNTFTAKYKVSASTGRFHKRRLLLMPL